MMRQSGFTLVELMLAVLLATLLTAGALNIYLSQSRIIQSEEQRADNSTLGNSTYAVLSRLLRHALIDTIDINYNGGQFNQDIQQYPEIANDSITIEFALPDGFPVWPNDKSPYDQNWIRLQWTNDANSTEKYVINIATASSKAALNNASYVALTSEDNNTLIANLDIWPLDENGQRLTSAQSVASGGYQFQLSARARKANLDYTNPDMLAENPLVSHRIHNVSSVIVPRN